MCALTGDRDCTLFFAAWDGAATSGATQPGPAFSILNPFCHALVSENSLVNTSHFILEVIVAFEGELYKAVKVILSSSNLNYEIG